MKVSKQTKENEQESISKKHFNQLWWACSCNILEKKNITAIEIDSNE